MVSEGMGAAGTAIQNTIGAAFQEGRLSVDASPHDPDTYEAIRQGLLVSDADPLVILDAYYLLDQQEGVNCCSEE